MKKSLRATRFTIDRVEKTSSGTFKVRGKLTKTGVFEYMRGTERVRELRSEAEVFSKDSLDTLEGAHVTIDHPSDFVDSDNWKMYSVGTVLSVKASPPYVEGVLAVSDSRAQHMVEQGYLKEISCGYFCTPVRLDSADADVTQTQIQYNHAALGPDGWGRLGSDVGLTLDSAGDQQLPRFEVDMPEAKATETVDTQEALPLDDHPPLRDEIRALAATVGALVESLKTKDKAESKPYKEVKELPTEDGLREQALRTGEKLAKLEFRARAAYRAVYPTRDTSDIADLVGEQLCKEILELEINDSRFQLEELVDRAEVSAARARAIAEDTKKRDEARLIAAAYGLPPREPVDPLAAHILGAR